MVALRSRWSYSSIEEMGGIKWNECLICERLWEHIWSCARRVHMVVYLKYAENDSHEWAGNSLKVLWENLKLEVIIYVCSSAPRYRNYGECLKTLDQKNESLYLGLWKSYFREKWIKGKENLFSHVCPVGKRILEKKLEFYCSITGKRKLFILVE